MTSKLHVGEHKASHPGPRDYRSQTGRTVIHYLKFVLYEMHHTSERFRGHNSFARDAETVIRTKHLVANQY